NGGGTVYYSGTAFTNQNSPGNSFTVLGANVALAAGSEQFGLQCTPAGSFSVTGTACPTTASGNASYSTTANTQLGTIAAGSSSTGNVVTYNANIATTTKPGVYQSNLTYSATASF